MTTPLSIASPRSLGFSAERLARIDRFLAERYIEPGLLPCALLLVARRGDVVHKSVLGHASLERRQRLAGLGRRLTHVGAAAPGGAAGGPTGIGSPPVAGGRVEPISSVAAGSYPEPAPAPTVAASSPAASAGSKVARSA